MITSSYSCCCQLQFPHQFWFSFLRRFLVKIQLDTGLVSCCPPVYVERIQTGFHHSGIPSYNASHCTTLTCCVSEENYEAQEANEDKVWIHCGHLKSRRFCTNHSDFLTRTTHSHFHRLGKNIPTPTWMNWLWLESFFTRAGFLNDSHPHRN